jgi:hypothetical protein
MPLIAVIRTAAAIETDDGMFPVTQREDEAVPGPYAVSPGWQGFQQATFLHAGNQVVVLALAVQPTAVVADLVLRIINAPALQILHGLSGQGQRLFIIPEHLAQQRLFFQPAFFKVQFGRNRRQGWWCVEGGNRTPATQRLCLYQGLMLIAFFHQLDELDRVACAGCTVAAEAAIRVGLGVDLKAWRFIRVEGAPQPAVLVRLKVIVLQYLADRQSGFDVGYLHLKKSFLCNIWHKSRTYSRFQQVTPSFFVEHFKLLLCKWVPKTRL